MVIAFFFAPGFLFPPKRRTSRLYRAWSRAADFDRGPGGHVFAVSHPYREPDRAGYTAASLDRVDRLGLGVIEQFERRPACIEGDDPPGPRTPIGDLFQPQRVTIEGKCLLEVLHGERDPQLRHISHDYF